MILTYCIKEHDHVNLRVFYTMSNSSCFICTSVSYIVYSVTGRLGSKDIGNIIKNMWVPILLIHRLKAPVSFTSSCNFVLWTEKYFCSNLVFTAASHRWQNDNGYIKIDIYSRGYDLLNWKIERTNNEPTNDNHLA